MMCSGGGGASGRGGSGGGIRGSALEPESIRAVKEAFNLPYIDLDKWLTLPRKYTRMVSRFELPIDSTELSRKYVFPSDILMLTETVKFLFR